jgi:hypothetical protein
MGANLRCGCGRGVSDSGPSVNFARPDRPNVSYNPAIMLSSLCGVVRLRQTVVAIVFVLGLGSTAWAQSQSFAYVAVPGVDCTSTSDASPAVCRIPPALLVVDASTSAIVTRISLSSGFGPRALQISRDGSRLYVVNSTLAFPAVLSVIDAQRHQLLATLTIAPPPYCDYWQPAVDSIDPALVYLRRDCSDPQVGSFDTRTNAFVSNLTLSPRGGGGITRSVFGRRFLITTWAASYSDMQLNEYDGMTGALTATLPLGADVAYAWNAGLMSSDSSRLYVVTQGGQTGGRGGFGASYTGSVIVVDPRSMTIAGRYENAGRLPRAVLEAALTRRLYVSDVGRMANFGDFLPQLQVYDIDTRSLVRTVDPDPGLLAIAPDGQRAFGPGATGTHTLVTWDLASVTAVASTSLQADTQLVVTTPPGASACRYGVDTHQSAWPTTGGSRTISLTTACGWEASSSASWARLSAASGSGNATLMLTVDNNYTTTNRSATLTIGGQLVTVTQASFSATAPFGAFDTPADNAVHVSGSIGVTGWALDDVGVTRVRIYRDPTAGEPAGPVYIGDATFVDGARPDVQAFYSTWPGCSRAGWGLLVLTNMLPAGGNGTFRLIAYADDVDGHTTRLGTKTFTADNSSSVLPFGAIDTPGQGDTVSGTIVNFGWALTGQPRQIPTDGSTIDVLIDNVVVGHPTYNNFRSDVASLFPGYANTDGAVGYFSIDTTQYANGVHTIAWTVRDNAGNTSGVGSRYFTIGNP